MMYSTNTTIKRTPDNNNINQIIHGDALTGLKKLPDSIIDVCVTSLPYWNQRWYGEDPNVIGNESTVSEYVDNLIKIFGQVKRVLKKSGSCFVVLSDRVNNGEDTRRKDKGGFVKYKDRSIPDGSLCNVPSRFIIAMTDRLGFVQKNDIIWEKPNGFPNGAAARRRFSINYEHVFFFVKDTQYYYFQTQYEPYKTDPSEWDNKGPRLGGRKASGYGSAVYSGNYWVPNICGKIKRSIWEINTQKQKDKFYAAYPEKLVEIAINACCPPDTGSIVLDPFLWSGTTSLVASKLSRKFIGIELCKEYVEMSHKR